MPLWGFVIYQVIASEKVPCVWNALKYSETDFSNMSVFRNVLKKSILAGFSMFQLYALFLIWAKRNPSLFFILFSSSICITFMLFSSAPICIHSSILLSAFIYTFLFLVIIYLFSFHLLHFTFTIFDSRSFQTLISYLHSYLHIWFHFALPLVLYMLNHAICRYYYI